MVTEEGRRRDCVGGSDGELASLIERAKLLAAAGKWDREAVDVNVRILKLRPGSLPACIRLATCCIHLGYLDRAEKLFLHVLRHDPDSVAAQQGLDTVIIRRKHQRTAEGIASPEEAFEQGMKARRRGNTDLAVILLERACHLRSDDAYRIALAAAYRAMGRFAEAESLYRSILDRGFNKAAMVGLAGVLRDQGRLDGAAALDREVLERFPDDSHAQWSLVGIDADKSKPPWERRAYSTGAVALERSSSGRDTTRSKTSALQVYFDGLCAPNNPGGYACGGWYIAPYPGIPALAAGLEGHAFYRRGTGATNNLAEYSAALDAMRAVYRTGYRGTVALRGDSQLVVDQFNGRWGCRKPELRELLDRLHRAATFFAGLDVAWIPREQNERADELSRQAYRAATGDALS